MAQEHWKEEISSLPRGFVTTHETVDDKSGNRFAGNEADWLKTISREEIRIL